MATLTGTEIKDSYQGLLKTDDNAVITASLKTITDGEGTASALSVSTVQIKATDIIISSMSASAGQTVIVGTNGLLQSQTVAPGGSIFTTGSYPNSIKPVLGNNSASDSYATVSGGSQNSASCYGSTVGGGGYNCANNRYATVGGGNNNCANDSYATVSGGSQNSASCYGSTVGGGAYNCASCFGSTVGGGTYNCANATRSTIGGGFNNREYGYNATIGGGKTNYISGQGSTVSGGGQNRVLSNYSVVGGGNSNKVCGCWSGILGGVSNTIRSVDACSFIIGNFLTSTASNYTFVNNICNVGGGTSDERLKEDIKPLTIGLNELSQLEPISYNFKADDSKAIKYGFLAQCVHKIIPELALFHPTETVDGDKVLQFEKDAIWSSIINAIKELKQRLETLENK
jgi:hypothetical protein